MVPGENCFVLYFRDGKILKAYRQQSIWSTLHKFPINALISSNNGKFLVSGDNRGFIYKYDNALNDKQGSF